MKQALPCTNFNSSKLIRFLTDLSIVDASESKQTFAERLGEWFDFTDAITLHAAHNASVSNSSAAHSGKPSVANDSVEEEFARARMALVNSITTSCSPDCGEARIKLPTLKPGVDIKTAAAYDPFHRFYLAHQSEMEMNIRPLRARVRVALSAASATLAQLAALDAALDKILAVRERQLLSSVPLLLEKRFEQLRHTHRQRLADAQQTDDPGLWMQAGEWLACFCRELQGVLLAELDLRLQPTVGLIEAFSNKVNTH